MGKLDKEKYKVILCGASFSGNMGAYAMYVSYMQELEKQIGKCEFTVLSKYPVDDKKYCDQLGCNMISFTSLYQLLRGGSFFLFGSVLKKLHLPYRWIAGKRLKAYFDNDILVDFSGIAFTDDRSNANILINTMWFLPAFVTKIPIIKISQSLGPFSKPFVKVMAKYVLNEIDIVITRGPKSFVLTKELLPDKEIFELPDMAFCLEASKPAVEIEIPERYNLLAPSYVMENKLGSEKYIAMLGEAGDLLWKKSHLPFILVPHSRNHSKVVGVDSLSDDLTVCFKLQKVLVEKNIPSICITQELNACELKWIIGHGTIAIGSRFHFMIASLSEKVPCVILGWNHKYEEVLQMVGLKQFVLRENEASVKELNSMVSDAWDNQVKLRKQLQEKIPNIQAKARNNCSLTEILLKNQKLS